MEPKRKERPNDFTSEGKMLIRYLDFSFLLGFISTLSAVLLNDALFNRLDDLMKLIEFEIFSQYRLNLGTTVLDDMIGFKSQRSSATSGLLTPVHAMPVNHEKNSREGQLARISGHGFGVSSGALGPVYVGFFSTKK